jgi:hypothetical protein
MWEIKRLIICWVTVAHTCNPSYTGGRDQEDRGGLKPAQANSSSRPYLKKKKTLHKNRAGGVAQREGPENE